MKELRRSENGHQFEIEKENSQSFAENYIGFCSAKGGYVFIAGLVCKPTLMLNEDFNSNCKRSQYQKR